MTKSNLFVSGLSLGYLCDHWYNLSKDANLVVHDCVRSDKPRSELQLCFVGVNYLVKFRHSSKDQSS